VIRDAVRPGSSLLSSFVGVTTLQDTMLQRDTIPTDATRLQVLVDRWPIADRVAGDALKLTSTEPSSHPTHR
jgi:hypothetical protein